MHMHMGATKERKERKKDVQIFSPILVLAAIAAVAAAAAAPRQKIVYPPLALRIEFQKSETVS